MKNTHKSESKKSYSHIQTYPSQQHSSSNTNAPQLLIPDTVALQKEDEKPIVKENTEAMQKQMQILREINSHKETNEPTVKEKRFQDQLLKNMVFTAHDSYKTFVTNFSKALAPLPSTFQSVDEFSFLLQAYIEAVAHNQILSAWDNIRQNKENNGVKNPKITVHSIQKTPENRSMYKIVIDLKGTDFTKEPLCDHLQHSVFLFEYKTQQACETILCISESFRLSDSPTLTLRFLYNKANPLSFSETSSTTFIYLTSILDCSRSYTASQRLSMQNAVRDFVTGNIPPFLIPSIDYNASKEAKKNYIYDTLHRKYLLNAEKVEFIYQILYANSSLNEVQRDFVYSVLLGQSTIYPLWGPPGSGKTKTLVALIQISLQLGLRLLVTSSTNQSISEVALRLNAAHIKKMCIMGVRKKLPPSLDNFFWQEWSIHLQKKISNIADEYYNIIETYFMDPTDDKDGHKKENHDDFHTLITTLDAWILDIEAFIQKLQTSDDFSKYTQNFIDIKTELSTLISQIKLHVLLNKIQENDYKWAIQEVLNKWERTFVTFQRETVDSVRFNATDTDNRLLEQDSCIYLATLGSLGRSKLRQVDITICDEGGQIDLIAALLAFAIDARTLVIAGDPRQLPAYPRFQNLDPSSSISILERLIDVLKLPHSFLKWQYRMNDILCQWVSRTFYDGLLITGETSHPRITYPPNNLLSIPVAFIHVPTKSTKIGSGYVNEVQAELIALAVRNIYQENPNITIGVIAYYAKQRNCLQKLLGDLDPKRVSIITVDGAQGREFDCLFVSSPRDDSIGFVKDRPRINVSLTRARLCLFLFGHEQVLSSSPVFHKFIQYVRGLNLFYEQEQFKKLISAAKSSGSQLLLKTISPATAPVLKQTAEVTKPKRPNDHLANKLIKTFERLRNAHNLKNEFYSKREERSSSPDIVTLQEQLTQLNEQLNERKNEFHALEQQNNELKNNANTWINTKLETEQEKLLQDATKKNPELLSIQKRIDGCESKLQILKQNTHSQYTEMQSLQTIHSQLQTEHEVLNTEFEKAAYESLEGVFNKTEQTKYASLAFATCDHFLRWALFCRLSYIAHAEKAYWRAIFYTMHVENYPNENPELERWRVLYKGYLKYIYQSCITHLIQTFQVPANILAYQEEDCKALLSSPDPYQRIVVGLWLIENERIDRKIYIIDELLQAYTELNILEAKSNFVYGFDALFHTIQKYIVYPMRELDKHNLITVNQPPFEIEKRLEHIADKAIQSSELNQGFQHIDSIEHTLRFVCLKKTHFYEVIKTMAQEKHAKLMFIPESMNILEKLKNENIYKTIEEWDQFILISYQLMRCYHATKQTIKIQILFGEIQTLLHNRQNPNDHSFMLGWFFFTYSIFLFSINQSAGQTLAADVLAQHPSMFEIHFFQEYMNQHLFRPFVEFNLSTRRENRVTNYNRNRLFHYKNEITSTAISNETSLTREGVTYEK